jgi:general secretion pathway protein G
MLLRHEPKRQRRSAFTLMEMLIVVAIIVALAGVGGYYLMGALKDSQKGIAAAQVSGTLTNACKAYEIKHSEFPPSLDELLKKDALGGPYLETQDALIDPWGRKYQYDASGAHNGGLKPDIWTTAPGTQEMIGNWSSKHQR